MSRIGKNPVPIPSGVNVAVAGQVITIQGKLGKQSLTLHGEVAAAVEAGKIVLKPRSMSKRARALWGTSRALINNGVKGVSAGFTQNQVPVSGMPPMPPTMGTPNELTPSGRLVMTPMVRSPG